MAQISAMVARIEGIRGNAEAAARHLADADSLAAAHGYRDVALSVFFTRAVWLWSQGDLAAEDRMRQYVALAAEVSAIGHQIQGLRFLAQVQLDLGRHEDAERALDRALELSESSGELWQRSQVLGLRAQAALDSGDVESADRFIEGAVESLREQDIGDVSVVHSHLGMIRAAQHRDAEAEAALRRAIDVVAGSEYHNFRISAGLYLTEFLATRVSRRVEAMALLDEYSRRAHAGGSYRWDQRIAEIQSLVKAQAASGQD